MDPTKFGDGWREFFHAAFVTAATIAPLSMVFGCGATVDTLSNVQ